ncbi:MAG: hypothetical protein WBD56_04720 [Anaerolineales bacterium]
MPCAGGGIVAGDVTQVRQRPIAGLGKASPHVQVVPRHRQRTNIIVQTLVGQRLPCSGRGIVAGDVAQELQRPFTGYVEPTPHIQIVPGHRLCINSTAQALVGQRVPCNRLCGGAEGRFEERSALAVQGHFPAAQVQRPLEAGGCVKRAVRVEQPTRRYRSGEGGWICLDRLGGGCSQRQG